MDHTNTYAIFWGTSWNTDPQFTRDKITSIQAFFAGFGGSNYANMLTEYGASTRSTFMGTTIDNSAAPSGDPGYSALISHVCSLLLSRHMGYDPNGFYAVYTTAQYLPTEVGYHTIGRCFTTTIHVALIFNTDGLHDFPDSTHRSADAEELASVTAHELFETITDPDASSGWYATNLFGEVADKCAYIPTPTPLITLSNGSVFQVQSEWSNLAFSRGTGYRNGNDEPGCLLGSLPWPTVTISGPTSLYHLQPGTFSATVANGSPPYQYYWHIQSNFTFVYYNNLSPTFTVTLYSQSGNPTPAIVSVSMSDAVGHSFSSQVYPMAYPSP